MKVSHHVCTVLLCIAVMSAPRTAAAECMVTYKCTDVGSTCSRVESRGDASITFTYVCSPCKKWFQRSMVGEKYGQICGARALIETMNDQYDGPLVWPSGECYTPSSHSTSESWSAAAETSVECPSSGGSTRYTLPCTPLRSVTEERWKSGYVWSFQGPRIPPGGSNGYEQTKITIEKNKDSGCPNPGRSIETKCKVSGDSLGLSCE